MMFSKDVISLKTFFIDIFFLLVWHTRNSDIPTIGVCAVLVFRLWRGNVVLYLPCTGRQPLRLPASDYVVERSGSRGSSSSSSGDCCRSRRTAPREHRCSSCHQSRTLHYIPWLWTLLIQPPTILPISTTFSDQSSYFSEGGIPTREKDGYKPLTLPLLHRDLSKSSFYDPFRPLDYSFEDSIHTPFDIYNQGKFSDFGYCCKHM